MSPSGQTAGPVRTQHQASAFGWVRPVILVVALIAAVVLAKMFGLGSRLGELRGWIGSLGAWGPVAFVFLYAVAAVAALPGSALTIAAGALFGSVTGIIVVSLGSMLGASAAFLIARYFARDAVRRWLSRSDRLHKLDELSEKHGAIIVAITRLVPLFPFDLLNYGFGLTKVRFWTYFWWSWLCMLPGTILYVVGADAITKGLKEGKVPWPLVGVLLAAVALVILLVQRARRLLKQREQSQEG